MIPLRIPSNVVHVTRTSRRPSHDQIAQVAHRLYLAQGCQAGYELDDWLRAERLLLEQMPEDGSSLPRSSPLSRDLKLEAPDASLENFNDSQNETSAKSTTSPNKEESLHPFTPARAHPSLLRQPYLNHGPATNGWSPGIPSYQAYNGAQR